MKFKILMLDDMYDRVIEVCGFLCEMFGGKIHYDHNMSPGKNLSKFKAALGKIIEFDFRTLYQEAMELVSSEMEFFDIGIIDLKWDNRNDGGDIWDGGRNIISKALEKGTIGKIFILTAHGERLMDQLINIFRASSSIGNLIRSDLKEEIRAKFPGALKEAALKRIESMGKEDQIRLRDLFQQKRITNKFLNNEANGWRLRDLLIGWRNISTNKFPSNLSGNLRALIKPDLTREASLCIGIGGIKQITHKTREYFHPYRCDLLFKDINERIAKFASLMDEVPEKVKRDCSEYLKMILDFQKQVESEKNYLTNICIYSQKLEGFRDKNLRFGNSLKSVRIEMDGIQPDTIDSENFELYLPVHKIFAKEIGSICKGTGKTKLFIGACLEREKCLPGEIWKGVKSKPRYTWNYLMFKYIDAIGWTSTSMRRNMSDKFKLLSERHFEFYGRFFIVFKEDGNLKAFELKEGGVIVETEVREIVPQKCSCNLHVDNQDCGIKTEYFDKIEGTETYFVFLFYSWRQK